MKKFFILISLIVLLFGGCSKSGTKGKDDYLIKVGNHVITVLDFNKALEFARTAYPHNSIQDTDVDKSVRLRLMNQLTEELILLNKAEELGISVSDEDIEKAIAEIKGDYPEGTFEKTFLENAVSYDMWRSRLKVRLLMEKVVAMELENKIKITREDIAEYYSEHYKNKENDKEISLEPNDINEKIIKSIRRKKAEDAYKAWMESIQKEYNVDINKEEWKKLLDS